MQKTSILSCRVTEEQQQQIDIEAGECGMSRNEYIIARLFIDQDQKPRKRIDSFERDLITVTTTNFMILQELAKGKITDQQLTKARTAADRLLIEKGYKKLNTEVEFRS